jgi:predicted ester cyclase
MSNRQEQRVHRPARRERALRACAVAGLAAVAAAAQAHAAGPAAATRIACAPDDPNLKAYLEMTDKMFVPRDASVAARYYAPQFTSHNQDSGGGDSTTLTPERFKEVYEASKRTFGERGFRNDLIICGGDYVVARVTMTSKMTGPMFGQPPTGKTAVVSATDTYRFKDGKVVERWGNNDGISMLQQLGLQLPRQAAAASAGAAPAKGGGGK